MNKYALTQELKALLKEVEADQTTAYNARQSGLPNLQLVGKAQADLLQTHHARLLDLLDKVEGE